jgi:hypothetical protein
MNGCLYITYHPDVLIANGLLQEPIAAGTVIQVANKGGPFPLLSAERQGILLKADSSSDLRSQ